MTYEQALSRLTALCARGEHCQFELTEKMRRWEIDAQTQARVMEYLIGERYVDEERYARFFIRDKVKYNKWGRRKVEQALKAKHIAESLYRPLLDEVAESEDYAEVLLPLLQSKKRLTKAKNDYELRVKLIRFALQRGFTMDVINKVLAEMNVEEEPWD